MTDFTIADNEDISKYDDILIHVYYHLINYDYRQGMFTDESSIYDMGGTGLSDEEYTKVADEYDAINTRRNLSYTEGQKVYFKLLNNAFDLHISERFKDTYGFEMDLNKHLLVDISKSLKVAFPDRNWAQENIFILRKFDAMHAREIEAQSTAAHNTNVVKLPVKKKLTDEEIRNGYNEYLMMDVLGMSYEDAKKLAAANFEKKVENITFIPYRPGEESSIHLS